MPWCVAIDCSNNSITKNRENDVSFYKVKEKMACKHQA